MGLTFKQKIVGGMMLSAMVPLMMVGAVSSYLSYQNAYKINEGALESAHNAISLRVEDYLGLVRLQVQEQALSPLVKDALREFVAAQKGFDAAAVPVDDAKLKERYTIQQQKAAGTKPGDENGWMPEDVTSRALQYLYISQNANPLGEKQKLDAAPDGSEYSRVHAKYHPVFRNVIDEYSYYDYFLVDAESGTVVYTDFKEIDFQSNVKTGPLAESGFSRLVKRALASNDSHAVFFSEIEPYMPSYNDPAIFVAAPIVEDGKTIGVVAFQLPTNKLNGLFETLKTMGETADGYLLGRDMKYRTPAISEDTKVGDEASPPFKEALKHVFEGDYDGLKTFSGSDGAPMLGAMAKLKVEGLDWAIVVGIDKAEMLASTYEQIYMLLGIMAAIVALCVVAGVMLSNALVKPVQRLAQSFGVGAEKVARSTGEVREAVSSMIAASEETSAQSTVIRKNSTEAAGYVSTVSGAIDELNVSIHDISQSIGETNVLIDDAVGKAQKTDEVVRSLGEASKKITEVVSLINDLAEQTNLLALNAAIEAARAGDAGRGFAVVADEVKKLASHTSQATVDIKEQVREVQDVSEKSVIALQAVVEAIHRIRDNATTVSAAVEEQSGVAKQIAGSVRDAANRVQQVDENMNGIEQAANDTGVAADQVSGAANEVQGAFGELKGQVQGVLDEMGIK